MKRDIIDRATEFSRDFELKINKADHDFLYKTTHCFMQEELNETLQAIRNADYPEIIDGFGDVAFIALNGIYKTFRCLGRDHEESTKLVWEVMSRICDANLRKRQPDGTILVKSGKVEKPKGWSPPKYEDLVG